MDDGQESDVPNSEMPQWSDLWPLGYKMWSFHYFRYWKILQKLLNHLRINSFERSQSPSPTGNVIQIWQNSVSVGLWENVGIIEMRNDPYLFYLDLPQSLGAGGRGGSLPQRGPEKDVLLLLILIAGQKLLLFSMKQPHHVSLREDK